LGLASHKRQRYISSGNFEAWQDNSTCLKSKQRREKCCTRVNCTEPDCGFQKFSGPTTDGYSALRARCPPSDTLAIAGLLKYNACPQMPRQVHV
jgi:hypothetical protein